MAPAQLRFLGTGAARGTPGEGRTRRGESSALIEGATTILLDAPRDIAARLEGIDRLDAVLLTHAHADAAGGLRHLQEWAHVASDVARPTPGLECFCHGVHHLVVDGATWRRRIVSHLRVDEDLPVLCGWSVGRIWLTQIGRSAPPHEELARSVAEFCPRALPAYDGLVVAL